MRYFGLVVLWALLVARPASAATLRGTVATEDGAPAAGILVQIYQAGPLKGAAIVCPSCYPDCAKHTLSAPDGTFTIEDLDEALYFQTLLVADGYEPYVANGVVPARGPLAVKLKRRDLTGINPQRILTGQVQDAAGRPVVGATIEPVGIGIANGTQFGGLTGIDSLVVSGLEGKFAIVCAQPNTRLLLRIEARGLAPRVTPMLTAGAAGHTVTLEVGAMVEGTLTQEERPLPGVRVALHQRDRNSETYLGEWRATTDAQGRFQFYDVAAKLPYVAYVEMDALPPEVTVAAQAVTVGAADTSSSVALRTSPALSLSGRVRLADARPFPAEMKLLICRDQVMDSRTVPIAPDGTFTTRGLGAEKLNLYVHVPGYVVAPTMAGYNEWNRNVDYELQRTTDGLEILLDPKDKPKPSLSGRLLLPSGTPAIGADFAIDREARPRFLQGDQIANGAQGKTDVEGRFKVETPAVGTYRLIAVHPEGYLIREQAELSPATDLTLHAWSRAEGTVLRDGRPLPGAAVSLGYVSDGQVMMTVPSVSTDAEGHYVFPRVPSGHAFLAVQEGNAEALGAHRDPRESLVVEVPAQQTLLCDLGRGATVHGRLPAPVALQERVEMRHALARLYQAAYHAKDTATTPYLSPVRTSTHQAAILTRQHTSFLSPDGSFELQGVPPGAYYLSVYLKSGAEGSVLASYTGKVVIEESAVTKDLGTLTPELHPQP